MTTIADVISAIKIYRERGWIDDPPSEPPTAIIRRMIKTIVGSPLGGRIVDGERVYGRNDAIIFAGPRLNGWICRGIYYGMVKNVDTPVTYDVGSAKNGFTAYRPMTRFDLAHSLQMLEHECSGILPYMIPEIIGKIPRISNITRIEFRIIQITGVTNTEYYELTPDQTQFIKPELLTDCIVYPETVTSRAFEIFSEIIEEDWLHLMRMFNINTHLEVLKIVDYLLVEAPKPKY